MLAATYTTELQTAYTHYASMPSPPSNILLRAVIRAFRRRYFVKLWIMRCVLLTLTMLRPFVLRELLVFVSAAFVAQQTNYDDDDQYTILSFKFASYSQISDGIYWSVTLSLLTLVMAFLNHHFWSVLILPIPSAPSCVLLCLAHPCWRTVIPAALSQL